MSQTDQKDSKEWAKPIWTNYNKQNNGSAQSEESLWSRVSEMVNAFNGELQMQRDPHRMKVDSVPVGVDCTLIPVLPNSKNQISNKSTPSATTAIAATDLPVKRVVCSPDLPVVFSPLTSQRKEDSAVDSSTVPSPTKSPQQTSGVNLYQCTICERIFNQKVSLTTHLKSHKDPQQTSGVNLYQCTICERIFNQKVSLTTHLKSHKDPEDPYQCNFCGKTFAVPARLTRHYRTHTGEKPYQCEFCNKSFSVKENLSVHKRIHTKERPYKCDVCERAFEHSGKLHRHMRIHTGERPHKCNYCSKTFIQSGQLVIHLRTHTGEKPYVCKCCGKGFTCSKQLKVHTRTHTGEKPYACDICGKSFGYNHVLKLHQVAHYGEKVYKCTICKETFNSKKSMETHIKLAHSESGNSSRGANEGESSCASSTSDKENKMEVELECIRSVERARANLSLVQAAERCTYNTSPSNLSNCDQGTSQMMPNHTTLTIVPVSENIDESNNSMGNFNNYGYLSRLPSQDGSLDQSVLSIHPCSSNAMSPNVEQHDEMCEYKNSPTRAYYVRIPSPSSLSDSSRSSPSPKLEIVENLDEFPNYLIPMNSESSIQRTLLFKEDAHNSGMSTSVIFNTPFQEQSTPPSSNSTSPVSFPDLSEHPISVREELILPPRKRSKAILKSMEKAKAEEANSLRSSSVIHYAKAF